MPIDKFITHNFEGLDKIQDLMDALHSGLCLRGVLRIADYPVPNPENIQVISNKKHFGGYLKVIKHWSTACNCFMTFSLFVPEDDVHKQRCEAYPVIYYLSGMTSNHENATFKSGFGPYAKKHNLAVVFPDTSPRDVEGYTNFAGLNEADPSWSIGYGAGQYCDATKLPWSKYFNMYTYCTEELPRLCEKYFHISADRKSVLGHSMGGNGALSIAARNPTSYKCVSAFAPMGHPLESDIAKFAIKYYMNNTSDYNQFDCSKIIHTKSEDKTFKMPNGLIDVGTADDMLHYLKIEKLEEAIGKNGHSNV